MTTGKEKGSVMSVYVIGSAATGAVFLSRYYCSLEPDSSARPWWP